MLNKDESVHGILVQLPLPPHIDADRVIQSIDTSKVRARFFNSRKAHLAC